MSKNYPPRKRKPENSVGWQKVGPKNLKILTRLLFPPYSELIFFEIGALTKSTQFQIVFFVKKNPAKFLPPGIFRPKLHLSQKLSI